MFLLEAVSGLVCLKNISRFNDKKFILRKTSDSKKSESEIGDGIFFTVVF